MQIRDLFEQTPAPIQPTDTNTADVGKLTATVSSLQKQVADLQKAALQQTTDQQQQAQPKPGEASQQQQPKGTVGAGQGNGTTAQKGAPVGTTPDATMLDMIKKLAGVGQQQQAKPAAPQQAPQAPGVNQTPQMTALKIKQDLAKSQGKST